MASKGALTVRFIGDTKSFDGANRRVKGSFGKVAKVAAVAFAAAGAAAVKFTKDAAVLDAKQREVVTLFGETGKKAEKSLGQVRDITRKVSDEFGIAQTTLTDGLYQAISAGVPKENALSFMQVASKAAIAGVTDVETAVDGITTTINAFGLKAKDAEAISDSMFTAVKGGKTTFAELSDSLFNVAPAAAAANVSFKEVNAALATITASGTPTSVATTQLRAALVGLQKPSKDMDKIFQDLGHKNAQVAIESEGLGFALDAVKKASGGSNGKLQELLGSSEAVAAANVLAGTGAKKFAQELKAQAKAAGATGKAYDVVNKGAARQFEILKTRLQNVGIEVGQKLLPVVVKLAAWFNERGVPALKRFGDYASKEVAPVLKRIGATITGTVIPAAIKIVKTLVKWQDVLVPVAAGIGAIVVALKVWAAVTKAFIAVQAALNIVLAANPIGLVILALVGIAAALVVAYKKSETFRNIVNGAFESVKAVAGPVLSWLGKAVAKTIGFVQKHWKKILAILGGPLGLAAVLVIKHWSKIRSFTTAVVGKTIGFVKNHWRKIITIMGGPLGLAVALVSKHWGRIKSITSGAVRTVVGIVKGVRAVVGHVRDAFADARQAAVDRVNALVTMVRGIPGRILSALGNMGRLLYTAGQQIIQGLIDGVTSKIGALTSKLKTLTNLIPKVKGPLDKDKKLLTPAGAAIMGGLIKGIESQRGALVSSLGRVTADIGGGDVVHAPRGGGGGMSVVINVNGARDPKVAAREIRRELLALKRQLGSDLGIA